MRSFALTVVVTALFLQLPNALGLGPLCVGAQHAIAAAQSQERETPDGEWCQRQAARMDKKAHACACHSHDCSKDGRDPNNLSAHTDAQCLNYCHTNKCTCSAMDCP